MLICFLWFCISLWFAFFWKLSAKCVGNRNLNYKAFYMHLDICFFSGFPCNLNYTVCLILLPVTTGLLSFLSLTGSTQHNTGRIHINNLAQLPRPLSSSAWGREIKALLQLLFVSCVVTARLPHCSLSLYPSVFGLRSPQEYTGLQSCSYQFSSTYPL